MKTFVADRLVVARGGRILAEDVSFTLCPGQALALMGANGSGKSTMLRILAGLARPFSGLVLYAGEAVLDDPEAHGLRLVFVGHEHGLKAELSVFENTDLWLALREPRVAVTQRRVQILKALQDAGLDALADRMLSTLSFGQARRVALCRLALVGASAPLWLLDEPFAGLDTTAAAHLTGRLTSHLAAGGILIAATHQPLPFAVTATYRLGAGASGVAGVAA